MAVQAPPADLGAACPNFHLPGVDGKAHARDDFGASPVLTVMFICNHCKYVKSVEDRIVRLVREFENRGVTFVGICANDAEGYPEDAFDKIAERWREKGYGFPYLYDEAQDVARAFGAVCTPDIFVYGRDRRLAYRGRIDDSWQDEALVKRRELAEALEALIAGRQPSPEQRPSMGCSIKWRHQDA
jgi:peroxiredoxin